MNKPFAIVTGASAGIGLELAAICAQEGYDLLVAADRPEIQSAADRFRGLGADVTALEVDLATINGVDRLWAAAAGRPVDALLANAGHGLGHGIGLQVHERPYLSPTDHTALRTGMVITNEPGIYVPDWGGVRLEEMVLITDTGPEVLTSASWEIGVG